MASWRGSLANYWGYLDRKVADQLPKPSSLKGGEPKMKLELLIHNHTPIITSEDEEALALALRSYLLAECEKLKRPPLGKRNRVGKIYNSALADLMKVINNE